MRLTRLGHSCVRIEIAAAGVLVVDPGSAPFCDAAGALAGADAVLVTHQHTDHLDVAALAAAYAANSDLAVFVPHDTVGAINDAGARATGVGPGESFTAAGLDVRTYGGTHATVHPDFPVPQNVGFLIGSAILHPGDSFVLPDVAVETLLVPAAAPWLKISESIDYLRAAGAPRAFPIHDAILSDAGLGLVDRLLGGANESTAYERLAVGASVEL